MAKTKLNLKDSISLILSGSPSLKLKEEKLSRPELSAFEDLSKQRTRHRTVLFYSAIVLTWCSFLFLAISVGANSYFRAMKGVQFSLFTNYELEVLSISLFGQIVGIIAIIAKSLWDESPLAKLFERDYDEKHKSR